MDQWSSRTDRSAPHLVRARRDIEEGTTLSKITVEQEPGIAETLLTAELDDTHTAPTFTELGVRDEIVRALSEIGIERTFAIQELTLPLALAGEDLIGQARTGMGKTFGFGVPLLHRIATTDSGTAVLDGTPRALIIVPTRELCTQVTLDLENASKYLRNQKGPLKVTAIYGGRPYESQISALRDGVDVVVGTPGRLQDLAEQGHLILGKIGVLVLDEADEMLDLGFLPDIERILRMVPEQRQTMLFSATMPGPIITLARTFLNRPTHIRAEEANAQTITERITQFAYRAHALDKSELVARILQAETRGATMIFARTKRTAQKVADDLGERGFAVGAVHGDLNQIQREKALKKFREGKIDVLVATDVAARGIDIDDVTHVVNYQCPEDEKTYVHRIGRTGRAGRSGVAITLVDWDELHRWASIDKALKLDMPEAVETYSRSPHLYAELGIPEGVTGQLRKAKPVRDEDAVVVEREPREARAPRSRNRKRTVRGRPLEQGENAAVSADNAVADGSNHTNGAVHTNGEAGSGEAGDQPARRRRRRRGKGSSSGETAAVTGTDAANGTAESNRSSANPGATETVSLESDSNEARGRGSDTVANGPDAGGEKSGRRRRRRRGGADHSDNTGTDIASDSAATDSGEATADVVVRDTTENAQSVVTSDQSGSAATGSDEVAEAPKKRTRAGRASSQAQDALSTPDSSAVADSAGSAVDADRNGSAAADSHEVAAAPKKRTRAKKVAEVTEAQDATTTGSDEAAEAPKKRMRAKKTADTAEPQAGSAASGSDEVAEAPKKRTRAKKVAEVTEAQDATTTGSDEAAEAPKKRTRAKKAVAATEAQDGSAAADSSEAAAAPQKRTRPKKVADDSTTQDASGTAASDASAANAGAAAEAVAAPARRRARRKTADVEAESVAAATDTTVSASA